MTIATPEGCRSLANEKMPSAAHQHFSLFGGFLESLSRGCMALGVESSFHRLQHGRTGLPVLWSWFCRPFMQENASSLNGIADLRDDAGVSAEHHGHVLIPPASRLRHSPALSMSRLQDRRAVVNKGCAG